MQSNANYIVLDAAAVYQLEQQAISDQQCTGIHSDYFAFTEGFGGAQYSENDTHVFPYGAESWVGFANMNMNLYPLSFPSDTFLSFQGAALDGGSVSVRFRFEYNPYPDVDPAFETQSVTISGATLNTYTVAIPAQGNNTFSSVVLYVEDQDRAVRVANVAIGEGCDPIVLEVPNTYLSIGEEAFKNSNLSSVILPDSITSIGARAFKGSNISTIEILALSLVLAKRRSLIQRLLL